MAVMQRHPIYSEGDEPTMTDTSQITKPIKASTQQWPAISAWRKTRTSKSKQQEANISTVKNLATKKCGRPGHPMTHLVLRAREPDRLESKISDIKKKVK